jgi:3-deoxy-manno-octulosonate cytidylyltransferase (CMP-KDO synthetase)
MVEHKQISVAAILPARYGSKRFPGKILADIKGKTLIQRTYENVLRCADLDKIIVATDDKRIFDHVTSFGGTAMMTPEECATGTDRLAYVVEHDAELQKTQIIVNVQGDEPCIDPAIITHIVKSLQNSPEAVMATAAVPFTSEEEAVNPSDVKCVMDLNGYALYFSRALIPGAIPLEFNPLATYYKHLGIYAYRPHFLMKYAQLPTTPLQMIEDLEQLKVLEHGYKIKVVVVSGTCIGVNTPEDIKKVEQELCSQNLFL